VQFDFETPYKGFFNVAAYGYKEWQHDGFASTFPFQPIPNPSGNVDFDPTWAVEINYSQPLGSWPVKYKALVVMHGPKGCGEPCQPLGPGVLDRIPHPTASRFRCGPDGMEPATTVCDLRRVSLVEEQVWH
jgi:hypothetical protein